MTTPRYRLVPPYARRFLATDLDDCVFNWIGGFRPAMETLLGRTLAPANDSWDMRAWLGVDDVTPHIHAFNTSPAYGQLEVYPCAHAVLNAAAAASIPIVAVTAATEDPLTHQMRLSNVQVGVGPIVDEVRFVPLNHSKADHLQELITRYGGAGTWVEDNYHNAVAGAELGYATFVIRREHNRRFEATSDPRIIWVDDYYAIGHFIGLNVVPD